MTEVLPQSESALTTTLKGEGKDAPWIVIRSKNAGQLQSQLRDLEHGSVFTDVGRVAALMNTHMRLGAQLKATPMEPQPSEPAAWVDPTGQAANAQPPGMGAPAPGTRQQSAPTAGPAPTGSAGPMPSQPQSQQGPPAFSNPGGQGMAPPMGANGGQAPQGQPPMGQPPQQMQQQTWGNAVIPPATQQQMQQPPAQQAPPTQQAPVWTPPGAPTAQPPAAPAGVFGAPATPGAPQVLGRAARFQSGSGAKGPWSAFFDPRSAEELANIPIDPATGRRVQTNDPNDPRLAAGQAEFTMFLK